jgi:hypothetical protein
MENLGSGLHIDRLAYARSLLDGAGRIAFTAKDEPISKIGIPFYLLIGFSIENSLKAFLDYKKYPQGSWLRSHDLADLADRSLENDLQLQDQIVKFVKNVSRYHKEFWFRYPEKAGVVDVNSSPDALYATEILFRTVFDSTDAPKWAGSWTIGLEAKDK